MENMIETRASPATRAALSRASDGGGGGGGGRRGRGGGRDRSALLLAPPIPAPLAPVPAAVAPLLPNEAAEAPACRRGGIASILKSHGECTRSASLFKGESRSNGIRSESSGASERGRGGKGFALSKLWFFSSSSAFALPRTIFALLDTSLINFCFPESLSLSALISDVSKGTTRRLVRAFFSFRKQKEKKTTMASTTMASSSRSLSARSSRAQATGGPCLVGEYFLTFLLCL